MAPIETLQHSSARPSTQRSREAETNSLHSCFRPRLRCQPSTSINKESLTARDSVAIVSRSA
eukprot:3555867-Rhodomonas_salina.4